MSGEFKKEVFDSFDPNPICSCHRCGKKLAIVQSMLDSLTGRTVRLFKCECGAQTWSEYKG